MNSVRFFFTAALMIILAIASATAEDNEGRNLRRGVLSEHIKGASSQTAIANKTHEIITV